MNWKINANLYDTPKNITNIGECNIDIKQTICKEVKSILEFVKDRGKLTGYRGYCKDCHNKYRRDILKKHINIIKLGMINIKTSSEIS